MKKCENEWRRSFTGEKVSIFFKKFQEGRVQFVLNTEKDKIFLWTVDEFLTKALRSGRFEDKCFFMFFRTSINFNLIS